MTDVAEKTRQKWLEVLEKFKRDPDRPGSRDYWSPSLDTASRDEIIAIQNEKLAAVTPFLYENSPFYRARFDRLGLAPTDIQTVEDLVKWPVIDKSEMAEDANRNPPFGTYTTHSDELWRERGWMIFSSSGTSGVPRVFRYSQIDRGYWAWANSRALWSMNIRPGDSALLITGFGPHVWLWGVNQALQHMGVAMIPGGGLDAKARATMIERYRPSVLACTPSYAFRLADVMQEMGLDPAKSSVKTLFTAGEPALGVEQTRHRLKTLWDAQHVEFYGCTEASPSGGGYSCPASSAAGEPVSAHLLEDASIWELVDGETYEPTPIGERGLTVCTNLMSESSPQLRFLVGDYTTFDDRVCACGRTHVRALGAFTGRADDLINLRGIKMMPSQLEEIIRAVPEVGVEYEIVIETETSGLDVMRLRIEHPMHDKAQDIEKRIVSDVRAKCEVRCGVEVLPLGTLPKTQFKARRVKDLRNKTVSGAA